jgi:hypothetical protein
LTFNKSENFETIIGGIGTLAMYLIVVMVGIALLIEMFQKTSISATQTFIYRNLDHSTDKYQIGKNGVAFALRVQHNNGTVADESIGSFRVEERAYIGYPEGDSSLQREVSIVNEIELEPCSKESDIGKINWIGTNPKIKWFKHNNYHIGGREFSEEYYALSITFNRCTGISWKSLTEIEEFIDSSAIMISIANQYFDFNNIEEPVQYFMDSYFDILNSKKTKIGILKARKNEYTLNDALFYGNPLREDHFFSIHEDSKIEQNLIASLNYYQVALRYDPRVEVYERTLKNSIDVFGDIGGIFEIVHILLMIPISFISSRLLQREVCNKILLYEQLCAQEENEHEEPSENESSNNQSKMSNKWSTHKEQRIKNYQEMDDPGYWSIVRKRHASKHSLSNSKAMDISIYKGNQYTYSDLMYNMFCCCKTRKRYVDMTMRRRYERYKEFEKIMDEFKSDLDWVKISQELIYLRKQVEELKQEIYYNEDESSQSANDQSK